MDALKRVVMTNIQSHVHTVLEFPRVGIVRFLGDNSNGKSVMVKVLQDVVSNSISRPAARRSIIRRNNSFGELLLESWSGNSLYVRIHIEAAQTYAELTIGTQPTIRRYLSDKAIPLLVREFGWHYDDNTGISINIHNDTDGFLFVDTKKSVNFNLINGMRSDAFAESALAEIDRLTKETRKKLEDMRHLHDVAEATYLSLQYWDIDAEAAIRDECLYYADLLENLSMPALPKAQLTPQPTFYNGLPQPPVVTIPVFYRPIAPLPEKSTQLLEDLVSILNGTCPTCGRPFISGGVHSHEVV